MKTLPVLLRWGRREREEGDGGGGVGGGGGDGNRGGQSTSDEAVSVDTRALYLQAADEHTGEAVRADGDHISSALLMLQISVCIFP